MLWTEVETIRHQKNSCCPWTCQRRNLKSRDETNLCFLFALIYKFERIDFSFMTPSVAFQRVLNTGGVPADTVLDVFDALPVDESTTAPSSVPPSSTCVVVVPHYPVSNQLRGSCSNPGCSNIVFCVVSKDTLGSCLNGSVNRDLFVTQRSLPTRRPVRDWSGSVSQLNATVWKQR